MRGRRPETRRWTARLAALLLVVQAAALAFATGAAAEPAAGRDRFGNALCSADAAGRHSHSPSPENRHAGGLDCCTAGCPMFGGPAPAFVAVAAPAARFERPAVRFALRENGDAAGVPASPRNAQGPPVPAR